MDMDRMDEMARNPRFIPGIYNYCDAWCARCAFTYHCMTYTLAQEEEAADSRSRDSENEAFWDRLDETFETTMEKLEEMAEDMDFDLGEEELEESMAEQEQVREAARSMPCSRTAMRYMDVVDQWFQLHEGLFVDQDGELEFLTGAGASADCTDDVTSLRDCLEVIRWYQRQIWVKLCRAAGGTIRADIDEIACFQEDADGSAKVALIGIERSLAAWATVLSKFPDHEDAIFALTLLQRLLRQVEAAFPHARAFRRPGFDDE